MQSIQAKVKYPCDRDYTSKQPGAPDYTTLKVDIGGVEERVFINVGTPEYLAAKQFKKGESILLGEDKGKYKLIITNNMTDAVQMTTPPKAQEPQEPRKLDAEQAKNYALTYAAVFNLLSEKMPVTTPAEVVGTAASTVFIALTRN